MGTLGRYAVGYEALRTVAGSAVTASYAAIGSALASKSELLMFINTLDGDVMISFDGTTDHLWLPSSTSLTLNLATIDAVIPSATTIYVKDGDSGPTAGQLRIATFRKV